MIKRRSLLILITLILFILATLVFLVLIEKDTSPSESWTKIFGKRGIDETFYSVQQTSDGGFVLAGYINWVNWTSTDDILLVKTDSRGMEQWSRIFSSNTSDRASSVQQTSDGGFILADFSGWVIKSDERGYMQWNRTYKKRLESVQQTSDGGYIFSGSQAGSALLIKVNSLGNEQWNKTIRDEKDSIFLSAQQTFDGGYIAAGTTNSGDWTKGGATIIIKTDADGNVQWRKNFKGFDVLKPKYEGIGFRARSVRQTQDGGYIVAGRKLHVYVDSFGDYSFDSEIWLVKLDVAGNEQWNRTFGKYDSYVNCIQQTSDGEYVLVGYTNEVSWFSSTAYGWIIKTDKKGTILWNKRFDSKATPFSVQQTSDGGYVVAGYVYEEGDQGKIDISVRRPVDGWVIKLRREG